MKLFVQLEGDGSLDRFEVGAAYYYPRKGWRVRAYHETGFFGTDSVEGQGTTWEAALQDLKANWVKSWWYTGAPAPKLEETEEP